MDEEKLRHLLYQYFNNSISPADCVELLEYLNTDPEKVAEIIDKHQFDAFDNGQELNKLASEQVFQRIRSDVRFDQSKKKSIISILHKQWFKVAAAVLIICSIALFRVTHTSNNAKPNLASNHPQQAIIPGSNKATLTLSNHQVIALNNSANGVLAQSGSLNVNKVYNGKLVYIDNKTGVGSSVVNAEPTINTLTTPNGGQYQVVLEDGTKVWLNSASSISYPDKFTGNERHVKLTGEAYFEVAKNKQKPFYVDINNVQIKVLGTHFNISAYNNDDDVITTLLEGAVAVSKNNANGLLKPGQQAVIMNNADNIRVSQADVEQAIAWKNGYFSFNDENMTDIMKKISRWYDVDVEYEGNIKNQQFGGVYSRSKSITELLSYLEKLGNIHFEIQGRRVIVMK